MANQDQTDDFKHSMSFGEKMNLPNGKIFVSVKMMYIDFNNLRSFFKNNPKKLNIFLKTILELPTKY